MSLKRKIMGDMVLNIIAVMIPVASLQLVVYPITARIVGSESYGLMLTVYSVWIMISNSLGNVLNNVRLLHNNEYGNNKIVGDFSILLKRWSIINSIAICGALMYYCGFNNIVHIVLGIIVSILVILKDYTEVGFRIHLNYKAIFINNFLQGIGFFIGTIGLYITHNWECIFLCGYLFSCIYCIKNTQILKEPSCKTTLFNEVSRDANQLVLATVISNAMNYADKLVLYPLMGGHAVSIYYTATILGKIIGLLTGPIISVVLSYISKWKNTQVNVLNKVFFFGVLASIIGYGFTLIISRPVLSVLFPQWVDEVVKYIPITTINVLLLALVSIVSPFILKFYAMKWQIIMNTISSVVYFSSAFFLWKRFGLIGFCYGTVIGTLTKLLIMIFVHYIYSQKRNKGEVI